MSVAMTWTPSFANRWTTAAPMPLAAPVTSAFLPRRPLSGIGSAVDVDRRAGHVGGVVGAERDDQRGGFGDGTDASHRNLLERTFRAFTRAGHRGDLGEAAKTARRRRGQILRRDAPAAADAVDEHVDAPVLLDGAIDHRVDRSRIGCVGANAKALGQRPKALLVEVGHDDLHALFLQAESDCVPDAVGFRSAGDYGDAVHRR